MTDPQTAPTVLGGLGFTTQQFILFGGGVGIYSGGAPTDLPSAAAALDAARIPLAHRSSLAAGGAVLPAAPASSHSLMGETDSVSGREESDQAWEEHTVRSSALRVAIRTVQPSASRVPQGGAGEPV